MKFENKGKWFNESEDTDKDMLNDEQQELAMEDDAGDLLAEDEMDLADEDIDDDSEGIFDKEDDKEPEQKNERHLFKKGDRVNALGNTGTIASVYYEDPAETRKRFKVLMDKNKKVEVFTEPELRFVESVQKNEANMLRDTEIAFDNIGGGISCFFESDKYGQKQLNVSVGMFSSSSRGNYAKSYGTMSRAEAEKQQSIDKPKMLKELKSLADNLDKNVKTILAKYGYTLSK